MRWHFWNQHKPDLCPDGIREGLEGALKELCALLEYRKQTEPCAFCKLNNPIHEKLKANPPKLKNQYKVIKE